MFQPSLRHNSQYYKSVEFELKCGTKILEIEDTSPHNLTFGTR